VVGGQIIIVEFGGIAFQVTRLYGRDWAISLIIGLLALPLGALVRLIPSAPIERFLIKIRVLPDPSRLPTVSPESEETNEKYEYNPALSKVKDNLSTYANIRGGRLRASSIVAKSRSARLRDADIQLPSLLTMVPTLIAGTVGYVVRLPELKHVLTRNIVLELIGFILRICWDYQIQQLKIPQDRQLSFSLVEFSFIRIQTRMIHYTNGLVYRIQDRRGLLYNLGVRD